MYHFIYPSKDTYVYEVDADTEEEARQLLEEEGGIEILGELCDMTSKDYRNATLEETWESA